MGLTTRKRRGLTPTATRPSAPKPVVTTGMTTARPPAVVPAGSAPKPVPGASIPATPRPAQTVQPVRPRGLAPALGPRAATPTRRQPGGDQRVDVLAADMMGQDSLLMQKAAAEGMQAGASRGMMNSTLSAQAGQSAALEYVVPMASQNAAQAAAQNLSAQEYVESRGLARQGFRYDKAMADKNAQIANKQTKLQASLTEDQTRLEANLAKNQTNLEASLAQGQAAFEAELARQQAEFEAGLQTQLNAQQLAGEDRRGAEATMSNIFNDYQDSMASIMANPNLSAEERNSMIESSQAMVEDRMAMASLMYGEAFDWPKGMFGI
jgi:hypothetical protein